MSDSDEYENDLVEEEANHDEGKALNSSNLLSSSPIRSTKPIPIGGRKDDDDKSSVESYESFDSDGQPAEAEREEDRSELQKQLYEATKKLVAEGEKNVSLALDLEKYKDALSLLQKETDAFRSVLLRGINGGVADSNNYSHVSLDELLRLRVQESAYVQTPGSDISSHQRQQSGPVRNESSVGVVQQLERQLDQEAQEKEALEAKILSLKGELEEAARRAEGVDKLQVKVSQMVQRLRTEREVKFKVQKELSVEKNKVEALSDHIEKLMIHLKHEAIAKARSQADQSRLQREIEMTKMRTASMLKKNERKDQVITELRESGKLLEDQLRLMDEKYMELRTKLDWTRTQTERVLKKKEAELQEMRLSEQGRSYDDCDYEVERRPRPKVVPRQRSMEEGRRSVIELHKKLNAIRRP